MKISENTLILIMRDDFMISAKCQSCSVIIHAQSCIWKASNITIYTHLIILNNMQAHSITSYYIVNYQL